MSRTIGSYEYVCGELKQSFFKQPAKLNKLNLNLVNGSFLIDSLTKIPFHYPIPIQWIWWEYSLTRAKINNCNKSGELLEPMWGVESNFMITACRL